jgi:hypothetical protein
MVCARATFVIIATIPVHARTARSGLPVEPGVRDRRQQARLQRRPCEVIHSILEDDFGRLTDIVVEQVTGR